MADRLILAGGFSEEEIIVLQDIDNTEVKTLHLEDNEFLLKELISNSSHGTTPFNTKVVIFHNFRKIRLVNFLSLYRDRGLPRAFLQQ